MTSTTKKVLVGTGLVAGVAAILYLVTRESALSKAASEAAKGGAAGGAAGGTSTTSSEGTPA